MEASEPLALVVNLDLLTPRLVLPQSYVVRRLQEDFLGDQAPAKDLNHRQPLIVHV